MYSLLLGMLGFLLFFLYDVNSFTWRSRLLHKSFALGVTLLAAATVLDLAAACLLYTSPSPRDRV